MLRTSLIHDRNITVLDRQRENKRTMIDGFIGAQPTFLRSGWILTLNPCSFVLEGFPFETGSFAMSVPPSGPAVRADSVVVRFQRGTVILPSGETVETVTGVSMLYKAGVSAPGENEALFATVVVPGGATSLDFCTVTLQMARSFTAEESRLDLINRVQEVSLSVPQNGEVLSQITQPLVDKLIQIDPTPAWRPANASILEAVDAALVERANSAVQDATFSAFRAKYENERMSVNINLMRESLSRRVADEALGVSRTPASELSDLYIDTLINPQDFTTFGNANWDPKTKVVSTWRMRPHAERLSVGSGFSYPLSPEQGNRPHYFAVKSTITQPWGAVEETPAFIAELSTTPQGLRLRTLLLDSWGGISRGGVFEERQISFTGQPPLIGTLIWVAEAASSGIVYFGLEETDTSYWTLDTWTGNAWATEYTLPAGFSTWGGQNARAAAYVKQHNCILFDSGGADGHRSLSLDLSTNTLHLMWNTPYAWSNALIEVRPGVFWGFNNWDKSHILVTEVLGPFTQVRSEFHLPLPQITQSQNIHNPLPFFIHGRLWIIILDDLFDRNRLFSVDPLGGTFREEPPFFAMKYSPAAASAVSLSWNSWGQEERRLWLFNMATYSNESLSFTPSNFAYEIDTGGDPSAYDPTSTWNQEPWGIITADILPSRAVSLAYSFVSFIQGRHGTLLGVQFSRDQGLTWSETAAPESLVSLGEQSHGAVRLRVTFVHDAELVAYAFGVM